MNKGTQIARVLGINIKIDLSWLLLLLPVVWNLSSALSQAHPEWGMLFTVRMGILAALLFFLSVLLIEFAYTLFDYTQVSL